MKRIMEYICFSIVAVLVSSCGSDWLDETANTKITAEEQFGTEEGFKDALMGVYISMTSPEMYARNMSWYTVDILSQQYVSKTGFDELQRFEYKNAQAISVIENIWLKSYNCIANINLALEYMEKNKSILNPVNYSIIKGELLGLRAFIHFDMMRLYGHGNLANRSELFSEYTIPYVTSYGKDITNTQTYTDTFTMLEADLSEALELLEEDPVYPGGHPDNYYVEVNRNGFYDNREQRMNYFAVKGLQARVLLWEGKKESAAAIADKVIAEAPASLINSENYSVENDPVLYPEILFCLDITNFTDITNPLITASNSTNYNAVYHNSSYVSEAFETGNINIGVADVRYNTLMKTQELGVVNSKLIQGGTENGNKMPLLRLPEMYYIAAEYYAESGQTGLAASYLNAVRNSRGILEAIEEDTEIEDLEEELLKEYRKEFLGEGQLFYFYKRTGAAKMLGLSEDTVLDDDIYMLPYPDNETQFGNR